MSLPPYPLWSESFKEKLIAPDKLADWSNEQKNQHKKIASLNGSFDLLHAGHLQMFYEASLVADVLIVALNSDSSIRSYKGPTRPLITLENRLQMVAALDFVDYVTWFEETDPCKILRLIKPDVHVNGEEYGKNCIEAETVKYYGGTLHLVKRIPGLATSALVEKIIGQSTCV